MPTPWAFAVLASARGAAASPSTITMPFRVLCMFHSFTLREYPQRADRGRFLIKAHHWIEKAGFAQPCYTSRPRQERAPACVRSIGCGFLLSRHFADNRAGPVDGRAQR